MSNKIQFNPVQCTSKTLDKLTKKEGYLYFTTDTKKIFLGQPENTMIPMCSASGFFYGTKEIKYPNNGVAPDPNVTFTFKEIEGTNIPEVDDLILNVDGCFYRVKKVTSKNLETVRLTLQGTGGGGGGGGGGSTGGSSWSVSMMNYNYTYSSMTKTMAVSFQADSEDPKENYIRSVSFSLNEDGTSPFYTYSGNLSFNKVHTLDLINYINNFSTEEAKLVYVFYKDRYGNARDDEFSIQLVQLEITAAKANIISSTKDNYLYGYTLKGGSGFTLQNRDVIYEIYHESNLYKPVYTQTENVGLSVQEEGSRTYNLDLSSLSHGIYILRIHAAGKLSSSDTEIIESNILEHKLVYYQASIGTPLLAIQIPEVT